MKQSQAIPADTASPPQPLPDVIEVSVDTRKDLETKLDTATNIAIERGCADGKRGILLTRYGPGSFTVELTDTVPYGTVMERIHA
ncbi:hypothetical protein ACIPY3_21445 [Paenarthrobacter sp. NPDC089714]|uniref:hypothetical protein n=1 Tax=Paenarthrobacter sp. NPDC089714 TaxID=3364377 RepID=UPI003818AAC6